MHCKESKEEKKNYDKAISEIYISPKRAFYCCENNEHIFKKEKQYIFVRGKNIFNSHSPTAFSLHVFLSVVEPCFLLAVPSLWKATPPFCYLAVKFEQL